MSKFIDANKLKEATTQFEDCDGYNPVWEIIDKAQSVPVVSIEECYEMYGKGYHQGCIRAEKERVVGRWVDILGGGYYCSNCNTNHLSKANYCPNCGAKMEK